MTIQYNVNAILKIFFVLCHGESNSLFEVRLTAPQYVGPALLFANRTPKQYGDFDTLFVGNSGR